MLGLLGGFIVTQALGTVARLGIAELVPSGRARPGARGPRRYRTSALRRVLRALASIGVFHTWRGTSTRPSCGGCRRRRSRFGARSRRCSPACTTAPGRALTRVFAPGSPRSSASSAAAIRLARRAPGGRRDLQPLDGRGAPGARPARTGLVGTAAVVDVGGGTGALLSSLLPREAQLRGTVFDLPHPREGAEATIGAARPSRPLRVRPKAASSRRCRRARTSTSCLRSSTTGTTRPPWSILQVCRGGHRRRAPARRGGAPDRGRARLGEAARPPHAGPARRSRT